MISDAYLIWIQRTNTRIGSRSTLETAIEFADEQAKIYPDEDIRVYELVNIRTYKPIVTYKMEEQKYEADRKSR